MDPATIRASIWSVTAALSAGVAGLAWMAQPVEVPLIGLLVMTFVPTLDLVEAVRTKLPSEKTS